MSSWQSRGEAMFKPPTLTSRSPAIFVSLFVCAIYAAANFVLVTARLGIRRRSRLPQRRPAAAGWRAAVRQRPPIPRTCTCTRHGSPSPGFRLRCCRCCRWRSRGPGSCWPRPSRPVMPFRHSWAGIALASAAGRASVPHRRLGQRAAAPGGGPGLRRSDAGRPMGHWRDGLAETRRRCCCWASTPGDANGERWGSGWASPPSSGCRSCSSIWPRIRSAAARQTCTTPRCSWPCRA